MPACRKNAGLPTPGASYGGWEWSESEVRGQFIGHYMSAVAFAALHTGVLCSQRIYAHLVRVVNFLPLDTGRTEFYDRSKLMVHELKKVQDAFGNGYLCELGAKVGAGLALFAPAACCWWKHLSVTHNLSVRRALRPLQPPSPRATLTGWRRCSRCGRPTMW